MSVSLSILGSGSRGNAAVIASGRTRVLIDCGFSRRELQRRLAAAGYSLGELDAVLITHEHSDHVSGLGKLAAAVQAPVFLNEGTRSALGPVGDKLHRCEGFATGLAFSVGDIEVCPFSIPHDAAEPVGFALRIEGIRVVWVTDLGHLSSEVRAQARGADCLVIESNHDLEMLKSGGYPWELKQRVLSQRGHLSNDSLAGFLASEYDGSAAHLVLAHLSENNNLPALARLSAERALAPRSTPPRLHVASQHEGLPAIRF